MRYFFTVAIIAVGWAMLAALLTFVDDSQHFGMYLLAMLNTFVMIIIGFRSA